MPQNETWLAAKFVSLLYSIENKIEDGRDLNNMKPEIIITEQELPTEVIRAIKKGKKIEAIKILRETKGLGLANAKVLVDRAASRLAPKPYMSAVVEQDSGSKRLVKTMLLVMLLAAFYYLVVGI